MLERFEMNLARASILLAILSISILSPAAGAERGDRSMILARSRFVKDGVIRETTHSFQTSDTSKPTNAKPQNIPVSGYVFRYVEASIYHLMEWYPSPRCEEVDPGSWTVTTQPQFGVIRLGTLTSGDPTCPNKEFTFAEIAYTWTSHTNKTVDSGAGAPTDKFTAIYKSKNFQYTYDFTIHVPSVRPIGETNVLEGWKEGNGRWRVTLVPPADDAGFDFTGETIRETYVDENESCTEPGASAPNEIVIKNGPPGNFGDSVGYSACVVEYARAARRTPCGFRINQKMEISAPADGGRFTEYSRNSLFARVTGTLIDQVRGQHGIGTVRSLRVTPLSPSPAAPPRTLLTQRTDCFTSLGRMKYLFKF